MGIFFNVVLPTISVFSIGYILQRFRYLDVKSISTMAIYIFLPALVFKNLYESTFDKGFTIILIYAFLLLFTLIIVNKFVARLFGWSKQVEGASILTTVFMNGGNYGVPIIFFGLGEEAMPYAIFFMVAQSLIMNSFGVYYASRGKSSIGEAVVNIFRMPATYAAILAFIFQGVGVELSESIYSMLTLLAGAAIPVMMVVLGMQLASITGLKLNWQVIISATSIRMFLSPLLALGFIYLFHLDPIIGAVILIVSSMPSAVTTTLYAVEFDSEPELVSSITLVTTLLSVVTLTVLLNML